MDTLAYITQKYNIDITLPSPIEIRNTGREILGDIFRELGYKVGAEIGVEKGIYSSVLLRKHPTLELFCIDSWEPYEGYICKLNQTELPSKLEEAQARLVKYNVHFYKQYSMKAVKRFKDNTLDFVYIDANHDLPWVMDDIIQWSKKVRPGGIVAGHDYIQAKSNKPSRCKVREAIHWYAELKPVKTWFLIGANEKVVGEIRDNDRTWFYVRE